MSAMPPLPAAHGSIPNYLVWAIVSTVFATLLCCTCVSIPGIGTGIAAIVFAAQVNKKLNVGDIDGALKASNLAKILNWITTAFVVVALIWFIYSLASGGMGQFEEQFQEAMKKAQQSS